MGASFTGGAATHALLTDSSTSDQATIQIAKQNQGAVSFKDCTEVTFEPNNSDDFTLEVTTDQNSYQFDETDFNRNKKKFKVKTGDEIPSGEQIKQATLDGTTYQNPNYPC